MRISTKICLDSVRILELAGSYFRLANSTPPPKDKHAHKVYFIDQKTEALPFNISGYNSSVYIKKKAGYMSNYE